MADDGVAILQGVRPVTVPDPLEVKARYAQLAQLAGNQQIQQQQIQSGNLDLQQRQQDLQDQQTLRTAFGQTGGDLTKLQAAVAGKISPKAMMALNQAVLEHQKTLGAIKTTDLENEAKMHAAIGSAAGALNALPDTASRAAAYPQARQQLIEQGHVDPNAVPEQYPGDQWLTQQQQSSMTAKEQADQILAQRKERREEDTALDTHAESLAKINNWTADQQYKAGMLAKLNTPAELAFKASDPKADAPTKQQALDALKILETSNIRERQASQPAINVSLTPQGQAIYDGFLKNTGQAIAIPRGQAPQVIGALNRIGAQDAAAGTGPTNLAANKADYASDKTSLGRMVPMRDAVVTFEKTANANLDMFVKAAAKLPDTGIPALNGPLRKIDLKVLGSDEVAAVNAARQVANNEIAKVTSNPNLSGALSDSARHEVADFNPDNATFAQTLAVARTLRADMANRHMFLDAGVKEIQERIKNGYGAPAAPAAAAGPAATPTKTPTDTATGPGGHKIVSYDNQKTWVDAKTGKPI